jgi:hypothetical protein
MNRHRHCEAAGRGNPFAASASLLAMTDLTTWIATLSVTARSNATRQSQ